MLILFSFMSVCGGILMYIGANSMFGVVHESVAETLMMLLGGFLLMVGIFGIVAYTVTDKHRASHWMKVAGSRNNAIAFGVILHNRHTRLIEAEWQISDRNIEESIGMWVKVKKSEHLWEVVNDEVCEYPELRWIEKIDDRFYELGPVYHDKAEDLK